MKKTYILLLHLHLALATQHYRPIFNKWTSLGSKPGALSKRSIGYQPEFGACEEGQETCSDACGDGFEECGTGTDAAVFCYKPDEGETCCGDKDGTACDDGFYCASGGDGAVCCPDSLSLSECEDELKVELSSISFPKSSSKEEDPPKPEPTPEPEPPATPTTRAENTTDTKDERPSTVEDESTTTITKSSTTTVIRTVPFPSYSPSSPATSRPPSASPATPFFPVYSTSHLSPSSFSSSAIISPSAATLPSRPSFINTTTSPIDEAVSPINLVPTSPANITSATGSIGVPIFLPTALDSLRCDLDCDGEFDAEVEVCFTETVTERLTVTLQDDSNGCERVTALTPTFTLTTLETIMLDCSGSRREDAAPRITVNAPGAIATQRTDEKPKATETVYPLGELLGNVTARGSGGIPAGIATQQADEEPKATVYNNNELPEDASIGPTDEIPEGVTTQRAEEQPEVMVFQSGELPGDTAAPSDPEATGHKSVERPVIPSTIYDYGEDGDDEEDTRSTTLMPSTMSTASADVSPTFEAFETAAGTRALAPGVVSVCISLLAFMGFGIGI